MFRKSKRQRQDGEVLQADITTIIGPGYKIKGSISGEMSAIRIDGEVIGDILVQSEVILGKEGLVNGDIHSDRVVVFGEVVGNISGKVVELKSSASIVGDVKAEQIDISSGAEVNGKLETIKVKSAENIDSEVAENASVTEVIAAAQ